MEVATEKRSRKSSITDHGGTSGSIGTNNQAKVTIFASVKPIKEI